MFGKKSLKEYKKRNQRKKYGRNTEIIFYIKVCSSTRFCTGWIRNILYKVRYIFSETVRIWSIILINMNVTTITHNYNRNGLKQSSNQLVKMWKLVIITVRVWTKWLISLKIFAAAGYLWPIYVIVHPRWSCFW